jgi:hypothetical protein
MDNGCVHGEFLSDKGSGLGCPMGVAQRGCGESWLFEPISANCLAAGYY